MLFSAAKRRLTHSLWKSRGLRTRTTGASSWTRTFTCSVLLTAKTRRPYSSARKRMKLFVWKTKTSLFHRIFGTTTGDLLIQLKIQTGIVNGFENQAKSMRRSKRRGILLLEATAFPMRLKRFPFIGSAGWLSRISINLKTGSMGIDCGVRIRLTGANCWCAR